jgi:hypothetical protein
MAEPECEPVCIRVATWNTAAVNNNPFEYWVTSANPLYDALMLGVQDFTDNQRNDVCIKDIFTDEMFEFLCSEMMDHGIIGIDGLQNIWRDDFRTRMAIQGFLMDKSIGAKRLASMPDRITNTIKLVNGRVLTRPSAISAYDGPPLDSLDLWWIEWVNFMFHSQVQISTGDETEQTLQSVCSLIEPLLRRKYPEVSPEEQAISIPLQILCLAILDAIFIFVLNAVQPTTWESVRRELSRALISNKASKTCSILARSYLCC